MSHEFETGFFTGTPAWHKLGTVLDNPPTVEQAIVSAGLDWTVNKEPLFRLNPTKVGYEAIEEIPGHKALVRDSDSKVLGVMTDRYYPLQNIQAFKWFNFLLHEGNATLEAAGSLKGGKRVWVLAKVNIADSDVGNGDTVQPYLLLSNAHDGTAAVWLNFTPIRVVCWNTLTLSMKGKEDNERQGSAIKLRHSASLNEQMSIAQNVLEFSKQQFTSSIADFRAMNQVSIGKKQLDEYYAAVLKTDLEGVVKNKSYDYLTEAFESGIGNQGKTVWDALQSVTQWLDHERGRNDAARLESTWFGEAARIRQQATNTALALI